MDLSIGSEQRISQKISPVMFQSLSVLQMNAADLREFVIRECEKNPTIEPVYRVNSSSEDMEAILGNIRAEKSIEEYILDQVPEWDDPQREILISILANLDDRGFFTGNLESIAAHHRVGIEVVDSVLSELKTLKPYGIGAEDLREAMLIQIDNIACGDEAIRTLARRIIPMYTDDLLRGSLGKISRMERVSIEGVAAVARLVSRLSFAPLLFFNRDTAPIAIHDAKIFKKEGEWIIQVDDGHYPQFRFSDAYKRLLTECRDSETVKYLKTQARNARMLTNSLQRRRETLGKVLRSILSRQMQFFEHGVEWLNRLSMREVAGDIAMNISTVSRAISDKRVDTPHGIFKLTAFFESGVSDCSAAFIKTEMRKLMLGTCRYASDQKIANILAELGIVVSRRTIAKYRRQENIPNSRIRRIR